jgi:hypothetical protein
MVNDTYDLRLIRIALPAKQIFLIALLNLGILRLKIVPIIPSAPVRHLKESFPGMLKAQE